MNVVKRPDPPVPSDGSCYVCGGDRRTDQSRRYAGVAALLDPFCSNTCARAYHGVELTGRLA